MSAAPSWFAFNLGVVVYGFVLFLALSLAAGTVALSRICAVDSLAAIPDRGRRTMPYFNWNPDYDTGIAGIDYEHHRLVKMLNEIHDLIVQGVEPHKISDALADFHALATAHFALEEKIMQDENYLDLGGRRHTHYRLLDQVREIMDGYEAGAYQRGERLPATLKEWLLEAIDIDAKLFAEINDAGLRRWGLSRT